MLQTKSVDELCRIIPPELQADRSWVLWDRKARGEAQVKIPFQVSGQPAKSNDRLTWTTFALAMDSLRDHPRASSGPGYMFAKDRGRVGIDLDDCIIDGKILPWAAEIVKKINSYTERSPGGQGLKIFAAIANVDIVGSGIKHVRPDGAIEIYDNLRYFTVTGHVLPGYGELRDATDEVHLLYEHLIYESALVRVSHDVRLCREHLRTLPDAVDGAGGSNNTFRAICDIYRYVTDPVAQVELINGWNEDHCMPAWNEEELEHKRQSAYAAVLSDGTIGTRSKHMQSIRERSPTSRVRVKDLTDVCTGSELHRKELMIDFLVNEVLVRGQGGIVGGPTKSCKTNIMMDLALSIANGSPFLGCPEFATKQAPVLFCSYETGEARSQMVYRAICEARGLDPAKQDQFLFTTQIPKICDAEWLKNLRKRLIERETQVLLIDPLYISVGDRLRGDQAGVLQLGDTMEAVSDIGVECQCTVLLAHHVTKSASRKFTPMDLVDLSGGGISEFMRQWILLSRRSDFRVGSGHHELHFNAGGSAGHGILKAVDIEEGDSHTQMLTNTLGWDVTVRDMAHAHADDVMRRQEQQDAEHLEEVRKVSDHLYRHILSCGEAVTVNALHKGTRSVPAFPERLRIIKESMLLLIDSGKVVQALSPEGSKQHGQHNVDHFEAVWEDRKL